MNFIKSRCLLVVFVYFSAAVLAIVDGQSTTDDDTDKDEIKLIDRIIKLEYNLAVAVNRIAELEGQSKPDACKFSYLCIILRVTFNVKKSCDLCSAFLIYYTTLQNFTPIGCFAGEKLLTGQTNKQTNNNSKLNIFPYCPPPGGKFCPPPTTRIHKVVMDC